MSKNEITNDIDYITTQLERLHPVKGDIFILNINSDDPEVVYSDEVTDSVDQLTDILEELTGEQIPILLFGSEIDLSVISKKDLQEMVDALPDDEESEDDEDSEHLINLFE